MIKKYKIDRRSHTDTYITFRKNKKKTSHLSSIQESDFQNLLDKEKPAEITIKLEETE